MRFALTGVIVLITAAPCAAIADDYCNAVATVRVFPDGATNFSPGSVDYRASLKPGAIDEAVSGYAVDKKTGVGVFSAHGGVPYPRFVIQNGRRVEALRLMNCRIGSKTGEDAHSVYYDVVLVRPLNSERSLREHDVNNRMLELDVAPPCAANAAVAYTRHPKSYLGVLTRKALEGNPEAVARLRAHPLWCGEGRLSPP